MGFAVEERLLNIDEVMAAHRAGTLREVFGTGTAATISMIRELRYKDYVMEFDTDKWTVSREVKTRMNDIREGKVTDKYGWLVKV